MSTLEQCLKERRSVRRFTKEEVSRDLLRKLVESACQAPSGSNIQPWEFIVVDEAKLVENIVTFSPGIVRRPPCLIVLCADRARAEKKGGTLGREQLALMDLSMAAENLMLRAVDLGLGSCAIKSFPATVLQRLLHLPQHIFPELIVTVGYPEGTPAIPPKRRIEEVLHLNGWEEKNGADME